MNKSLCLHSTPQCDPTTDDCSGSSCSDEVPPGMTLTCQQILSNDLCSAKSVTQGNYCQQSCGTCGKSGSQCFTTIFGCKCLRNWEYQTKRYSGCANPDGDSFGSWCQIESDSCSELDSNNALNKPKFYDYCADNCVSQPPPSPCNQNQKIGADDGQVESDSFNVKIVKVANQEVVLGNFGQTTVNISGWTFVDPYFVGQDKGILFKSGLSECKQRVPTFILPQDLIRLKLVKYPSWGDSCDILKPSISTKKEMILYDDQGQIIQQISIGLVNNSQVLCYNEISDSHEIVNYQACSYS